MKENHQTKNEHLTRLSIRSKIMASVILTAFIVFSVVIGLNVLKITELEAKIETRKDLVNKLNGNIASLNSEIYSLKYSPTDKITPRATANILPANITENGKRIYDYTVWIDLSSYRQKSLTSVSYAIIGNDVGFEDRTALNKRNGFSITFRGTSCVSKIKIDILFSDDTTDTIVFEMCKALE
jgi:cell division protein FtsB